MLLIIILKDYICIKLFNKFTNELKIVSVSSRKIKHIDFQEEIYGFDFYRSEDLTKLNSIDIIYNSPISAGTHFEYNTETNSKLELEKIIIERDSLYKTEIIYATSSELTKIPIRLFYNKMFLSSNIKPKGVILKTYGAYGYRENADFNQEDAVYASMGFVIAYAYVRGGGELGDDWYSQGRFLNKLNTFEDYKVCAIKVTDYCGINSKQLIGKAGSAGGVIMGYAANNYPELFGALIFDRPFLDVINEMCDTSTSMTLMQYSEWGNPMDSNLYEYQKKYSPYQQIETRNYPNMLFVTGLYDIQVPYWQVAKSVAKFRSCNTSNSLILMRTMMNSGHKGSTNASENYQNMLLQYAFIINSLKLEE